MSKPKTSLLEKIHWDRSRQYKVDRELWETIYVSEFRKGVLPKEAIQELATEIEILDALSDQAMDDMVESWSRSEQHRLYCLARTFNAHELMVESLRATETLTTDVEDHSLFESFSVEDSGSNAPPRSIHKSFVDYPRLLHDGGPPL
jgi:hypothetical protein